jgi:hypothetical protein
MGGGGVLGTSDQWDAFAPAWLAILDEPLPGKPPLSQFHSTDCRTRRGEFETYRQGERDHLTYRFRRVIVDCGFMTVAQAVDKAAWDQLVTGDVAKQLGNPLSLPSTSRGFAYALRAFFVRHWWI